MDNQEGINNVATRLVSLPFGMIVELGQRRKISRIFRVKSKQKVIPSKESSEAVREENL
jgi:hypothetical protein